jgi:DNA-binding transcriptional MocR family regulator
MAWREHIRFAPGSMFSASERYRHCLRLGLGGNWGQTEQAAMRRIGGLARTMAA